MSAHQKKSGFHSGKSINLSNMMAMCNDKIRQGDRPRCLLPRPLYQGASHICRGARHRLQVQRRGNVY